MFATLWLFGKVVLTVGYVGMTPLECENLKTVMIDDINTNSVMMNVDGTLVRNSDWKVTCEQELLKVGYENG